MTVTTTNNRNTYTTNGVTTTFPVSFVFRSSADLLVIFVSSLGVVSFPLLNTDFVVNMLLGNVGELVFTPAPLNGGTLHIIRRRTFVQATSSVGKEEFSAAETEIIADNLMFFIQDLADLQARSMVIQDYALDGDGQFDARSNRIKNLEDPVNLQDAVTKSYYLANLLSGGLTAEDIQDLMSTTLVAGANVTVTYNDGTGTITIASSGGGGGTSVTISDTAPGSPTAGNLWWNSTDGNMYVYYNDGSSSQWVSITTAVYASIGIPFMFDGGGIPVAAGTKIFVEIPFACILTGNTMMADVSTTAVMDIWVDTYANYPPTIADTITAAAKPTLTAAVKSQDNTLTGWTILVPAGSIMMVNVDSNNNATKLNLSLKAVKI